MASVNQDFVTFAGDTVDPIFTVRDVDGAVVDISGALEITWTARRNQSTAAVLSKTKTGGGGISFFTDGTDGKFTVAITAANTAAMTGWYEHYSAITDVAHNITTVTIGRMQVGLAPVWTYEASLVGTTDLYTVRDMIGDVYQSDQKLADSEVQAAIDKYDSLYFAGAECCRKCAARTLRKVDQSTGNMKTSYSQEWKAWQMMAELLIQEGLKRGAGGMYAGGISVSDKQAVEADTDRVRPQFNIGMFDDNLMGQVAHETIENPT